MENIHQRLNYDVKGPCADEDYKTQLYHIPPETTTTYPSTLEHLKGLVPTSSKTPASFIRDV